MASCFDTLVGLSARDCDCFSDGRPSGGAAAQTKQVWKHQAWESGASPADPLVLTTTFTLPETLAAENIQLFAGGEMLDVATDYTRTSDYTLSVPSPDANTTYQVWYLADVPVIEFTPAYDQSDSGLFISQLLPEEEITGLVNCDKTVWDVLTEARGIAIKEFAQSLNAHILRRHQVGRKTFSGYLGDTGGNDGTLSTAATYAGVRIRTNPITSGYLRISRIAALFSATGTIPVTIYDGEGTVMTPTFNLNTQANKKAFTDVGLTLPLLGDFNTKQDYFLVYEVDPANLPKLNKVYCSSCNGQKAITNVAYYDTHGEWDSDYQKSLGWQNWLIAGGWEGDSVAGFSNASDAVGPYMNGLALEIEVGCDLADGLCGMAAGGNSPEAMAAATFIQRRAAAIAVRKRLTSSTPARANFANKEGLEKEMGHWEAEAAEAMAYLAQNANDTMNDCVTCKARMRLGGILT